MRSTERVPYGLAHFRAIARRAFRLTIPSGSRIYKVVLHSVYKRTARVHTVLRAAKLLKTGGAQLRARRVSESDNMVSIPPRFRRRVCRAG